METGFHKFGQFVLTMLGVATLLVMALLGANQIITSDTGYAYVNTCGKGYCVYIESDGLKDMRIQSFIEFEQASKCANRLNVLLSDYKGQWRK